MNFLLNEEQTLLRDSVRRYVEKEYSFANRLNYAASGEVNRQALEYMVSQGWMAAGLDENSGGFGGGILESCLIAEELGRAMPLEPYWALAMAPTALLSSLSTPSASTLLKNILDGNVVASPLIRGSVGKNESISAKKVSATDMLITGAGGDVYGLNALSHILVVANIIDGNSIERGLFLVPINAAGLNLNSLTLLDESLSAKLALSEVLVSSDSLIATGDEVLAATQYAEHVAVLGLCSSAIGMMAAVIDNTVEYLKVRKQFNTAIGKFQSLQHRIADMKIAIEESRAIIHRAIAKTKYGDVGSATAVSEAKYLVSKNSAFVAAQGVQLHGAIGLTEEFVIGHYFRALTVCSHILGTPYEHLRNLAINNDYFTID